METICVRMGDSVKYTYARMNRADVFFHGDRYYAKLHHWQLLDLKTFVVLDVNNCDWFREILKKQTAFLIYGKLIIDVND
jgi:hypothetical protein